MKNKYVNTFIFYLIAIDIIFLLNTISPNAHDGGLGLGSLAILVLGLVIMALTVISIFKARKDKGYFVIAAIHFVILLSAFFTFLV